MNNKTTFWKFLEEHTIEIPIIQRDYAQGRIGKESLRKEFLTDLKDALVNNSEMKLDFVYGSTEKEKLFPLDGQQRLTTLWLLHWYIALKSRNLENVEVCGRLKKFTYETRISSREFCEELCKWNNFENFTGKVDIVGYIENQTWFYSAWKQDPTIQSMLRMLSGKKIKQNRNKHQKKNQQQEPVDDGIEKLFKDSNEKFIDYWDWLTDENKCKIVFYYLPLTDFGLSDDLYIKMNARGKQLTSFENFKADLIGYISNQAKSNELSKKERDTWEELLSPVNGLSIKLDTTWANIFWANRSLTNQVDEIFFAFFNRLFWNFHFIDTENGDYTLKVGKGVLSNGDKTSTIEMENASYRLFNEDRYDNYTSFDAYRYKMIGDIYEIPLEFFKNIQLIFERCSMLKSLPTCSWHTDFRFIPTYIIDKNANTYHENENKEKVLDVSNITQIYRIVFFAICKYFLENNQPNENTLKPWLRVIWNLVSGEDSDGRLVIRTTQLVRTAIEKIDELDSKSVYKSLIVKKIINPSSDFDKRWNEEVEKVEQILNAPPRSDERTWEDAIVEAENFDFFYGTIHFLYRNENGDVDWTDFDRKRNKAKNLQDIELIELAKYCNDNQITKIWSKYNFNKNNWKPILNNEDIHCPVHYFLLDKPDQQHLTPLCKDIENVLNSINNPNVRLISDWQQCEWVLTNYSYKMSDPSNGYVYEVGNALRNNLSKAIHALEKSGLLTVSVPNACGSKLIESDNLVYYRGLWIGALYKKNYFRYFGDKKIYLMTDNWENKILDEDNNPICLDVTDEVITNITGHLDTLISQKDNNNNIQ